MIPPPESSPPDNSVRDSAVRDGLIIAILVLASFVGSALLVLLSVQRRETQRVELSTRAIAWELASKLQPLIIKASAHGEPPDFSSVLPRIDSLLNQTADSYPLACHFEVYWLAGGDPQLITMTDGNVRHPPLSAPTLRTAAVEPHIDGGRVLVHIPILEGVDGEAPIAALVADSVPLEEATQMAGARLGFASAVAIGTALALASGFLVYLSGTRHYSVLRQLKSSERAFHELAHSTKSFIWEIDASGRLVAITDEAVEILGFSKDSLLGRFPADFAASEDSERIARQFSYALAKGGEMPDFQGRFLKRGGEDCYLSFSIVGTFSSGGQRHLRGVGCDFSEQHGVEQLLTDERESSQAADAAKSQFLAMMSHEIRTPLNSVLGFADVLNRSHLDPAQKEHLSVIKRSAQALLEILNEMLEFSRAEFDTIVLHPERTPVRSFFTSLLQLQRPAAVSKHLDLTLESHPSVPEHLVLDRARTRQIVLNLTGNAIKFTKKGSVKVQLTRGDKTAKDNHFPLRISISDTGIGIAKEQQLQIFRPFTQLDSTLNRRFGGVGLGLSICRRLARLFEGDVWLEESSPEGSTFCFEFPCPTEDPPAETSTPPDEREEPPAPVETPIRDLPRRTLVVEDNTTSRKLMVLMLGALGCRCVAVDNGKAAVDAHITQPFDVILMDIQMPVMDGLEATRLIREQEKHHPTHRRTRIIALTANALDSDRSACMKAGMDDFLTKPIRREVLAQALAKYTQA